MKILSYFNVALTTTLNIILNALTFGRYLWLEGRMRGGVFMNWARRFRYKPLKFVKPRTEQEIVELVNGSQSLRVFGSGHSFNSGVVSAQTLVSLDEYCGLIKFDPAKSQMIVKAGTRVRDVVKMLLKKKLAFRALPSHDAQSMAGILSTDVHGTGRTWGFVSQCVEGLKIVDGRGQVHECVPQDDLFKAAIGGVGVAGVVAEVVVQGVPRFKVNQRVMISELSYVEQNLDQLLADNQHFSLYLFPFSTKCQINTWNQTQERKSFLADFREFVSISVDALLAAWFGNFMAYSGLLPHLSTMAYGVKRGSNLVLESHKAYSRSIYYLHQELEFTVPFEQTFQACRRFIDLYEELYRSGTLPYALFEVRFTPDGHDRTLIGAGRERRCTWIDLVLNDSHGFERYYDAAEQLMKEVGARPHLGKFCKSFTVTDMQQLHGANFAKFQSVADIHDPERKFSNDFTRRVLGH